MHRDAAGIDGAARVVAHEIFHLWVGVGPWKDMQDSDGDGIPDIIESILDDYDLLVFYSDTYNVAAMLGSQYASYGDEELLARKAERGKQFFTNAPKTEPVYPQKDCAAGAYGKNYYPNVWSNGVFEDPN